MARVVGLVAVSLVLASCGGAREWEPGERTTSITTSGCGYASGTSGTGVLVGDDRIVTAAHVVVAASELTVSISGRPAREAIIAALDTDRDLAVLTRPDLDAPQVALGELEPGDPATIEGAVSGPVTAEVLRRVAMSVDEVRGFERTTRAGYELAADISGGDSGAGLYDENGRLAGLVFAVPTERDGIVWATRAEELESLMDPVAPAESYVCDPEMSRVVLEDDPEAR